MKYAFVDWNMQDIDDLTLAHYEGTETIVVGERIILDCWEEDMVQCPATVMVIKEDGLLLVAPDWENSGYYGKYEYK